MRAHALASARALSKRWLVNLMPRCRNLVVRRGRAFRLFRAQQRKAASGVQVLTRWPSAVALLLNGVRPWPGRIRSQRRSQFRER